MKNDQEKEKKPKMRLFRGIRRWPVLLLGFVFVSGMVLGILIFSLFRSSPDSTPMDILQLKGSMMNPGTTGEWKSAGTLLMQEWLMKATCQARYNESLVELYINLSSGNPMETTIEFDAVDFEFKMVVSEKVDSRSTIFTSPNQVKIRSTGENRLAIRLANLDDQPHTIRFQIVQNDNLIYQNAIKINNPE